MKHRFIAVLLACLTVTVYAHDRVPENAVAVTQDINLLNLNQTAAPSDVWIHWLNHHLLVVAPVILNHVSTLAYDRATQMLGEKTLTQAEWTKVHCTWATSQLAVDSVALAEGVSVAQLQVLQTVGLAKVKHDAAYAMLVRVFVLDADRYRQRGVSPTTILDESVKVCLKDPDIFGMRFDQEGFKVVPSAP
jgi:hypothetical protein